jgi:nucleoside-diphosphate-sugar epimerase
MPDNPKKILVTGAFGQIGTELVLALQNKYGKENVIAMDINVPENFDGVSEKFDILDKDRLTACIIHYNIGEIYHLVSLLSARGEQDPDLTWKINVTGLKSILDIAVQNNLKVFWPSSIAAFGPTTPRDNTPQSSVLEPTTMYGVTKVAGELLCRYYQQKYHLDVRTIRYPGLISWKAEPGGGTTDYAVAIFYDAIKTGKYDCFVSADTVLPMMYMDDAIRGTLELMNVPKTQLTDYKPYNFSAISFRADELASEINKLAPCLVEYHPDGRQQIANSWPKSIDDSDARTDWGWRHVFDLPKMVSEMYSHLKAKLSQNV